MFKKALLLSSVLVLSASFAHADKIFQLTQDGCTGSCGSPSFGTVTLTQTSANVVTVTEVLKAGEYYAGTGAGDALEFNVTGPITIGAITSGFAVGPSPDSASTFGSFLFSVTCTTCQGGKVSNPAGPLSFTVTRAGGITIDDFFANSGGFYFASDIFGNGVTGNVAAIGAGTPPPAVPEPASLMLFGTGLVGFAGAFRRRLGL